MVAWTQCVACGGRIRVPRWYCNGCAKEQGMTAEDQKRILAAAPDRHADTETNQ